MKKITLLCAFLLTLCANSVFAASDLTVYNTWFSDVRVKEGKYWPKESILPPGGNVTWNMLTGKVEQVSISYKVGGVWQIIPGCPNGSFNYGLRVAVESASWNPAIPVCRML